MRRCFSPTTCDTLIMTVMAQGEYENEAAGVASSNLSLFDSLLHWRSFCSRSGQWHVSSEILERSQSLCSCTSSVSISYSASLWSHAMAAQFKSLVHFRASDLPAVSGCRNSTIESGSNWCLSSIDMRTCSWHSNFCDQSTGTKF